MNTHRSHRGIGLVSLLVSLSLNMALGQAVTVTSPVFLQSEETSDLIEKGMTQDMVSALIGRPDEVYWDNSEKTMYHAVYKYEIYKVGHAKPCGHAIMACYLRQISLFIN